MYRYLRDVYELYLDLRSRRIAKKSTRRIAKLFKLSIQRKSHPIRILIEASAGPEDSRQKSRWTQALRYALGWQQPAKRLKWFFQVNGGIAGSARKYAVNKKAARQKNGGSQKNIIHREPGLGENSKTNQLAVRNQLSTTPWSAAMGQKQNLHALPKETLSMYARDLRAQYPNQTIRNTTVIDSAIREWSRFGYIELVDCRREIPAEIPGVLVRRLKRVRRHPIWIMGRQFPDDPMDMFDQMRPSMKGDKVVWRHHPSRRKPTWHNRDHRTIAAPVP